MRTTWLPWYRHAVEKGRGWTDPYVDPITGEETVSYVAPIRAHNSDALAGVVVVGSFTRQDEETQDETQPQLTVESGTLGASSELSRRPLTPAASSRNTASLPPASPRSPVYDKHDSTLQRMLGKYDANGDGNIDSKELYTLLTTELGYSTDEATEATVDALMQKFSSTDMMVVDSTDFPALWAHISRLQQNATLTRAGQQRAPANMLLSQESQSQQARQTHVKSVASDAQMQQQEHNQMPWQGQAPAQAQTHADTASPQAQALPAEWRLPGEAPPPTTISHAPPPTQQRGGPQVDPLGQVPRAAATSPSAGALLGASASRTMPSPGVMHGLGRTGSSAGALHGIGRNPKPPPPPRSSSSGALENLPPPPPKLPVPAVATAEQTNGGSDSGSDSTGGGGGGGRRAASDDDDDDDWSGSDDDAGVEPPHAPRFQPPFDAHPPPELDLFAGLQWSKDQRAAKAAWEGARGGSSAVSHAV